MKNLYALALCAFLSACGGGSGGDDAATPSPVGPMPPSPPVQPPPVPTATLNLSSPTFRTLEGGSAIPITATLSSGGTVRWQLAPGAPGSLSADSGNSVSYRPPVGGLAAPTTVTVTASGDGASAAMTLAVAPDPGLAGLTRIAWRPPAQENEPTMFRPRGVAADYAGNVYILLMIDASPSRRGPPELVKIAPDGAITKLIGQVDNVSMWFGQPDTANNAQRMYSPGGYGLDRAGNLYVAAQTAFTVPPGEHRPYGPAILKITPAGVLTVLAGTEGEQTATMLDGTGSAARFLSPFIVGVDPDGNVYVRDNDTPRKVTPAGVVTTLSALPAGLNADMNGNTYRWDEASRKLMRVAPYGTASVETSAPYCANFVPAPPFTCLDESAYYFSVVPISGASYALIGSDAVVRRLVLRR